MTTAEQYVLIAAVELVNEWRGKSKPLTYHELKLWKQVDRMQDEDTAPKDQPITGRAKE